MRKTSLVRHERAKIWPNLANAITVAGVLASSLVLEICHGHDASSCRGGIVGKDDKNLLGLGPQLREDLTERIRGS
jgi:hypothetical protein